MIDCGVCNIKQLVIKQLTEAFNTIHQAARGEREARYLPTIEIRDNKIYYSIIIMHIGTVNIVVDSNVIHDWGGDPIHIE